MPPMTNGLGTPTFRIGRQFCAPAPKNIAILITFVVVYFLIRAPSYGQKLAGEEGIFAYLFAQQPVGPDYGWYGRINGREIVGRLQHPAFLYEPTRWLGQQAERFFDLQTLSEEEQTVIMRMSFSLFQLSLWILLLLLVLCKPRIPKKIQAVEFQEALVRKISNQADREFMSSLYLRDDDETYALKKTLTTSEKRRGQRISTAAGYPVPAPYLVVLIFMASISPLAVVSSTQLQVDGSIGVWLIGLLSLGFYAAFLFSRRGRWQYAALLCLGSFAVALGKNEWSLALLFAQVVFVACVTALPLVWPPAKLQASPAYAVAFWSFLGLVLGNGASYFIDPLNYRGGLDIMVIFPHASIVHPQLLMRWLNFLLALFPYIFPMVILFLASAVILLKRLNTVYSLAPELLLLFFYSAVLFIGYLVFPWAASARYFAPAFVAFCITVIALSEFLPKRYMKLGCVVLAAVLANHALVFFLSTQGSQATRKRSINPRTCLQLLDSADGYLNQHVDFINNSFGIEYVENLARQYGKSLCVYHLIL